MTSVLPSFEHSVVLVAEVGSFFFSSVFVFFFPPPRTFVHRVACEFRARGILWVLTVRGVRMTGIGLIPWYIIYSTDGKINRKKGRRKENLRIIISRAVKYSNKTVSQTNDGVLFVLVVTYLERFLL